MTVATVGDYAAAISAAAALAALAFSIYVEIRTRKLLEPTERPVIALSGHPEVEFKVIDNPPRVYMLLLFIFKNIGKRPAQNLRMRIGQAEENRLQDFRIVMDETSTNTLDPGQQFNWSKEITQGAAIREGRVALAENVRLFFYTLVTYQDALKPKNTFRYEFWATYTTGQRGAGDVTIQEKLALERYVRAALGD